MIAIARAFFARPAPDRRLLLQALAVHVSVAALVRAVRFGALCRQLDRRTAPPAPCRPVDWPEIARIVWAVTRAAAVVPVGRTCLTEALTARAILRRAGCESILHYGVTKDIRNGLAAHAWLEYRGVVLIGESPRTYTTLPQPARAA
jgi:hypothetical protein